MPAPTGVVALLLAAGRGRRFDPTGTRNKLLAPAPAGPLTGVPLAVAAARSLRAAGLPVVAVVRPPADEATTALAQQLADTGCTLAPHENADAGMGTSIAAGVAAAPDAAGWLIALGDMPALSPDTIAQLVASLAAGATTVAPVHRGVRGHPVGFAASLRADLLALQGDVGAREVLRRHPPQTIDVDDPGVLLDIDTPA